MSQKIEQKDKEIKKKKRRGKISQGCSTRKYPKGENRKAEGIKLFLKNNILILPKIKDRSFQITKLQSVPSKVIKNNTNAHKF